MAAARAAAGPPSPERMAQLLRNRVPMNQQSEASQPVPVSASEPPPQVFVTPTPNQPSVPVHAVPQSSLGGRTAELAALENSLPGLPPDAPAPLNLQPQGTIPEIRLGSNLKVDPAAAQAILDTPPVGGINPRFRPPTQ